MILFYSATGNSRYVAKRLGERLGETPVDLLDRLKNHDYSELHSETPWVICCPTHAWQIPHILRDWIERTPLTGSRDIYFVLTRGGSTRVPGYAARVLSEKTGMNYKGLVAILMPENYVAMFPVPEEDAAREIVKDALPAIDSAADTIQRGESFAEKITAPEIWLNKLINYSFYTYLMSDKPFCVSDKCVSCGLCAEKCPVSDISIENGKPVWHGNCMHCMACICNCPAGAIEYGRRSIGKPRYKCPEV